MATLLYTAQEVYRDLLSSIVTDQTRWLDLGCGRELIRSWLHGAVELQQRFHNTCQRLVGIDAVVEDIEANPYLQERVMGNLLTMPFGKGEFNLVTSNMVVEHVEDPGRLLNQVRRVLEPGGAFLFVTPNLRHPIVAAASITPDFLKRPLVRYLEGRQDCDIFPTYYRLNSEPAIRRQLEKAGFRNVTVTIENTPPLFPFPVLREMDRKMDLVVMAR